MLLHFLKKVEEKEQSTYKNSLNDDEPQKHKTNRGSREKKAPEKQKRVKKLFYYAMKMNILRVWHIKDKSSSMEKKSKEKKERKESFL